MTLLEINLTDVLSETDPDDRVIVWAPVMREGPAGQLVGPRRKAIPLVDGVGSDEVVPGPLMVQVQCKAMSDTRPREVAVPETGPVTLTDLLHETFTYTPAVVSRSLTQITTARDDALADVDGAVDQALAGSQHYSGTGFPNGVVAAPVGSIYTDTAATAGAIRWIKTSGTGSTGWTVGYGYTGWRDVTGLLLTDWAGSLSIARHGAEVTLSGSNLRPPSTGSVGIIDLPEGFRPSRNIVGTGEEAGVLRPVLARNYSPFRVEMRAIAAAQSWANFTISFTVSNPWPTALPGVPA